MTESPDIVGSVYGVRSWTPTSTAMLGEWVPGVNIAQCRNGHDHRPPAKECGCGLYAYYGVGRFATNGSYGSVIGLVRGWGKVSVAQDGWRAQYAEIVAIAEGGPHADGIAAAYGVPTMSLGDIDMLSRNNTVPVELRPGNPRRAVERPVAVAALSGAGDPTRLSADHAELAWSLGFVWASAGVIAAVSLGVPASTALVCWIACIVALRAIWWRFLG